MKIFLRLITISILLTATAKAQDYSFHWGGYSPVFANAASNQVAYIDFGIISMWGYVEVTLTAGYDHQLSTGMYGKRLEIGKNPGNFFYSNSSEVYAAFGPVAEQWKLGEFEVNNENHLVLPIYHLVSSKNSIAVTINGVSLVPINTSLIQITTPTTLVNTESRDFQHTLNPVAIGTKKIDPTAKLTVGGKISAREIRVDINSGADFVFDQQYELSDLDELKAYIKANKHLPDIPAAASMVKNGVEVGAFQVKLLQKIEELTLYLLAKDEQVKQLEQRVRQLEKKNMGTKLRH